MARYSLSLTRKINKHRAKFPTFHAEYSAKKKTLKKPYQDWIYLSPEAKTEYELFANEYLVVRKPPDSSRKVWLTTHNGGRYVGCYENGQWYYFALSGKVPEKAIVIKWEEYNSILERKI